jgi:hypothetical protein
VIFPHLARHLGLLPPARLPQRNRLALELVREPALSRTQHHTPLGSAAPIVGVRQTGGKSPIFFSEMRPGCTVYVLHRLLHRLFGD